MRLALGLLAATLISVTGYSALGAPLSIPEFRDGYGTPKTIAVVVAHPHRIASTLVGAR